MTLSAAVAAFVSAVAATAVQSGMASLAVPREPFGWTVTSDPEPSIVGCPAYIINQPPQKIFKMDDVEDLPPEDSEWKKLGAVDPDGTHLTITLQGRTTKKVVLLGMRVVVVSRDAPAEGDIYRVTGCGGGESPRYFKVNLDEARPKVHAVAGSTYDPAQDKRVPVAAVNFPYSISDTDVEIFEIHASVRRCSCSWYLELMWASEDVRGTSVINWLGRPFRVSPSRGRNMYEYDFTRDRWRLQGRAG